MWFKAGLKLIGSNNLPVSGHLFWNYKHMLSSCLTPMFILTRKPTKNIFPQKFYSEIFSTILVLLFGLVGPGIKSSISHILDKYSASMLHPSFPVLPLWVWINLRWQSHRTYCTVTRQLSCVWYKLMLEWKRSMKTLLYVLLQAATLWVITQLSFTWDQAIRVRTSVLED